LADDLFDDPAFSFAAVGQEVALPTEPKELVDLAVAGQWDRVVAHVKLNYVDLVCNHFPTFAWLYRTIPPEYIESDPMMTIGREVFGRTYNLSGVVGQRLPDDPEELERLGRMEEVRDILSVATGQIIALRRQGLLHAAMGLVEKAEVITDVVTRHDPEPIEDVLGTLELQWAITRQLAGDIEGSVKPLVRSWSTHMNRAVEFMAAISASHISLSFAMLGLNHDVDFWLQRREKLPEIGGWVGEVSHVPADVARSLEAIDRLDKTAARSALQSLEALNQTEEFWAYVAYAFAQYELVFGHPLEGLARLERPQLLSGVNGRVSGDGISSHLMDAAAVDLYLASGHGTRASAILARRGPGTALWVIGAARLSLKVRDYDRAILQAGDELWNPRSTPRTRAELSLITAAAEYLRGEASRAVTELSRGVAIIEQNDLHRTLLTIPGEVLEKLAPHVPGLTDLLDKPAVRNTRETFSADVEVVILTDREMAVLQGLSLDRSMKDIAKSLFVSVDTARSHRLSLYRKLGVHSRTDSVIKAREWGLL
jgi:LuxR family maltose regulon positive regulatory protein